MKIKQCFFEENEKSFNSIMKVILEREIDKILTVLLQEQEEHNDSSLEVA